MDATDDDDLLAKARNGDSHALETLLRRHQDRVYRFGMQMCRNPEDAEDVLQETLLAAARSIQKFRGGSSLSTWLYAVARSFCIKKRRKSKFAPTREQSLEQDVAESEILAATGKTPDEAALGKEIQSALKSAIESLEADQREVLLLRDVEGLTASEVGEVLEISAAAVKSRLHRARVRVRDLVAPKLGIVVPAPASPSTCPDVLDLYSKHLEGEISADVCEQMERHLDGCERCRTACDSLKLTLSLCRRLPAAPVPEQVQESVRAALRELLSSRV